MWCHHDVGKKPGTNLVDPRHARGVGHLYNLRRLTDYSTVTCAWQGAKQTLT